MRRTDDVSLWPWTLTCGWCVSSFSICIPSLKFVGLAIRKIWRTMCVSINGPGDPDLWPFDLETGMRVAFKVGNLPSKFGHARPLGSRIIRYVCNGRTDKRTDGQKQRLLPPSLRGHNNTQIFSNVRCPDLSWSTVLQPLIKSIHNSIFSILTTALVSATSRHSNCNTATDRYILASSLARKSPCGFYNFQCWTSNNVWSMGPREAH